METYTYSKSSFPNGRVHAGRLHATITANAGITQVLSGVTVNGECLITFQSPLTDAEKIVLDGIVAAHAGADTVVNFHASSTVLSESRLVVTLAPAWEVVGELFTNPSFFVSDLTRAKGRMVGQYKTSGPGAVLRIVEQDAAGVDVVVATFNALDTAGTWQAAKFFTSVVPRVGDLNYRFEAQAPAGVTLEVRAFSLSLLEFITVLGI